MADPPRRADGKSGLVEVTDIDTMTALVRITFVFVAVVFMLTANRYYDLSLYLITVLFLVLQATVLMALARKDSMSIGRPAAMLAELLVFCAWMRAEPYYAPVLFTLFYLSVPMAAVHYRLAGSLGTAALAVGLYLWQVPNDGGAVGAWRQIGTSHFVPLLLVALITGALTKIRDQEREARFERERTLLEYRERVELARAVQDFTLPRSLPPLPAYDVALVFEVADYGVGGGDYYEARTLPGGRYAVCVADIAGKTISGVAKLPLVRSGFTVASEFVTHPSEIAESLNELFCDTIEDDSFIAAVFLTVHRDTGKAHYSVAGQVPPLLVRSGGAETEWLELGGPALGIVPGASYDEGEFTLEPGDLVVLSSDGLLCAESPTGEELGAERLAALACEASAESAQRIAETLRRAASEHIGAGRRDDLTILAIKRLPRRRCPEGG